MSSDAPKPDAEKIDDQLYSRQLYVLDHAAMARMGQSSVLVVGLGGLGVEIAKNLILMGVKEVALHCTEPASFHDLSANFYLSQEDVGKPRAQACVAKLAQLNQYVKVYVHDGELTEDALKSFAAVVCTQTRLSEELKLDAICRASGTKFISSGIYGAFSRVFVDCGDAHEARDRTGEPPLGGTIAGITHGKPAVVTMWEDERHGLEDGAYVTFSEVKGMEGLAAHGPFPVKSTGPYTFEIPDTTALPGPGVGGSFSEVKHPFMVKHRSLEACIKKPGELAMPDTGKIGRPELMLVGFQALDAFRDEHGRLPETASDVEADRVVQIAQRIASERAQEGDHTADVTGENARVVRRLALTARGVFSPLASAVGGIVAQEAIKAISGKFHPLTQWLFHDVLEMLPAEPLPAEEYAATGDRYDGQVAIIGKTLQSRILSQRYFLVGAGAIGCEILKTWAMMGIGCGPEGRVIVTDMDRIEKSNLSRQFLFRATDIGKSKSETAAAAAQVMNPAMHIEGMEERVGPETEGTFDDVFFEGLTGVCNALDNVEARLYVDSRCVFYKKPLMESGTLGVKGSTQIVVPYKTENYGATRDPPEKSTPLCILKNFPSKIEHTVQWARDQFEGDFVQAPQAVNAYMTDKENFLRTLREQPGTAVMTLETVKAALTTEKPTTFADCIAWARKRFAEKFVDNIKQLLHTFPPDHTTRSGEPFWSGHKRVPHPLEFDANDETHMAFINAASRLIARVYNIRPTEDPDEIRAVAAATSIPEFVPKDGVNIVTDPDEEKAQSTRPSGAGGTDHDIDAALQGIPEPSSLAGFQLTADEFEKDDDSNYHMEYVAAVANLRARIYRIEETTVLNAKRIAGKIIPAIATTTAFVAGVICSEMCKLVQDLPVESFRCSYASLALPLLSLTEPGAPAVVGEGDRAVTLWDGVDIMGPKTLGELIKEVETTKNVEITVLSCGKAMLYSFFMAPAKQKERLAMPVEKLAETSGEKKLTASTKYIIFEACANEPGDEDKDVDLPTIRYRIP